MTSPRNYRLAFGLACICSCALVAAEDPNLKAPALRFEESSEVIVLDPCVASYAQSTGQKVTYAAGIIRKPGTEFLNWGVTGTPGFRKYVLTQGFSEEQKHFLEKWSLMYQDPSKEYGLDLGKDVERAGRTQLLLYAVSLEDAKKMAQAYIDCMIKVYKALEKLMQDHRQDLLWKLSASRKRITEVDEAFKINPTDFDRFIKTVPYSSEKEAADAIGGLDNTLNAIAVEISGIQARLKAVQERQRDRTTAGLSVNDVIGQRLEAISIEESIALRAAEARRNTASSLRNQARRFIDLTQGPVEKRKLLDEVTKYEDNLLAVDRELASPKPPEIVDNKVFIHRVRPPE